MMQVLSNKYIRVVVIIVKGLDLDGIKALKQTYTHTSKKKKKDVNTI